LSSHKPFCALVSEKPNDTCKTKQKRHKLQQKPIDINPDSTTNYIKINKENKQLLCSKLKNTDIPFLDTFYSVVSKTTDLIMTIYT